LFACIVAPASAQTETGGSAPAMVEPTPGATPATPPAVSAPPSSPVTARAVPKSAPLMDVPNVPSSGGLTRAIAAWNAHLRAGKKDLEAGKWRAAESHYRAALVRDPAAPETLALVARAPDLRLRSV